MTIHINYGFNVLAKSFLIMWWPRSPAAPSAPKQEDRSEVRQLVNPPEISIPVTPVVHTQQRRREQSSYIWRSCCLEIDKRMAVFCVQVVVSLIVILFCIYMLFIEPECHSQQLYSSLLTLVIGVFLPSPRPSHGMLVA